MIQTDVLWICWEEQKRHWRQCPLGHGVQESIRHPLLFCRGCINSAELETRLGKAALERMSYLLSCGNNFAIYMEAWHVYSHNTLCTNPEVPSLNVSEGYLSDEVLMAVPSKLCTVSLNTCSFNFQPLVSQQGLGFWAHLLWWSSGGRTVEKLMWKLCQPLETCALLALFPCRSWYRAAFELLNVLWSNPFFIVSKRREGFLQYIAAA